MVARMPMSRRSAGRLSRPRKRRLSSGRSILSPRGSRGWSGVIRANASAFTFLGITLGVFVSRKFFALPAAVAAMAVQDLFQSWAAAQARRG